MSAVESLAGLCGRIDELIEEYRSTLHDALDGLT
jgi:hypothetical protein